MPGLLTHVSVALGGFLVLTFLLKNYKYGLAFLIGQLIPDTIKFGITGLVYHTTNFYKILSHPIYWTLNDYTHTVYTWAFLAIVIFATVFIFYKMKKIKKSTFAKWAIADLCFFASIALHLLLDALIIESSYWI